MRKALLVFYPQLASTRLVDCKVRVIDEGSGIGATVRMLIESSDREQEQCTVADSLEYSLLRRGIKPVQSIESPRLVSFAVIPATAGIQRN